MNNPLTAKIYEGSVLIEEIHVDDTGKVSPEGRNIYKIVKPKIDKGLDIVHHNNDLGYPPLMATVMARVFIGRKKSYGKSIQK